MSGNTIISRIYSIGLTVLLWAPQVSLAKAPLVAPDQIIDAGFVSVSKQHSGREESQQIKAGATLQRSKDTPDVGRQRGTGHLASDAMPLDTAVRYGTLDNGFTYYIRRNNVPEGEIELHMVVKAGINHEDEDQREYAHLLEHIGASATKHFPDFRSYFRGSGKYSNARTGRNFTDYFVRIPSGDKELLRAGLQSVRDRAQDILMDQSLIDKERGAVSGEMRTIDPYANWLYETIGGYVEKNTGFGSYVHEKHKTNMENFSREAFIRFYKDWYRPDLQAAIVVGDVNLDSIELHIKGMFSDMQNPAHPKDAQARVDAHTINLRGENQYYTVQDTERGDFCAYIISKRPNYNNPKNRSDYRRMLLQQLYREILTPRGRYMVGQRNSPISYFSAEYRANQMGGGQLWANAVSINFDTNDPKHLKKRFIDALVARKRMHTNITEEELIKAKTEVLRAFSGNQYKSTSSLAARYRDHFVEGQAALSPEGEKELIAQLIAGIDLKTIQKFSLDFVGLSRNTDFLFFRGKGDAVPDYDVIKEWVSEVEEMEVKPYESDRQPITSASLQHITRIPLREENVIKQISENLIGVTTIELRNNVKVVLKPTVPGGKLFANRVSLYAYRPSVIPFEDREDYLAATVSGEVIKHAGVESFNAFELDQFMSARGMRLNFDRTKKEEIINGQFQADYIEDFMTLLYLYTNKLTTDPEAFGNWKTDYKKQLKYGRRTSSAFYLDKIETLRFPGIPSMGPQDLNQMKAEKVYDVFNRMFSSFNGYTFIVTGDFDKDRLAPILVKYLSAFSKGKRRSSDATNSLAFPLKKFDETIYLGNLDQAMVRLSFPVEAPTDIGTKVTLHLVAKALHARIWNRLREGCYSPRAGGDFVDPQKGLYEFIIAFDSELSDLEKMIRYAKEEFWLLRNNGVDQQWLEKAIATEKKSYGKRIEYFEYTNFWPGYLKEKVDNNEDSVAEVLQYKTLLEHFTSLEDVNAAAKEYLSEDSFQSFVFLPKGYKEVDESVK